MICMELAQNYYHVENLEAFAKAGKAEICRDLYSDRAWAASQVKVASLLEPEDLNIVYRAYLRPRGIFAAVVPLNTPELVAEFYDANPIRRQYTADALADMEVAIKVLDSAVFPRRTLKFWGRRRPQLVELFYDHVKIQKAGQALRPPEADGLSAEP
jgi:hypothetical protein